MAYCKTAGTTLLTQWSYCSLALSHHYVGIPSLFQRFLQHVDVISWSLHLTQRLEVTKYFMLHIRPENLLHKSWEFGQLVRVVRQTEFVRSETYSHNAVELPRYRLQLHPKYNAHGEFIIINDDVIKWKHFLRYWPFVPGNHRSPVNSTHKGQWRGALVFSMICAWINGWVNNREAGDLRRHRAHYDVTVMLQGFFTDTKVNIGLPQSQWSALKIWVNHSFEPIEKYDVKPAKFC